MTKIIATVGPAIASKEEISKMIKRGVNDFWVNYGLKKDSSKYINMLYTMKMGIHPLLKIYLELPASRCRHIKEVGEINEDCVYKIYDETVVNKKEKNYLIMSNLSPIMNDLEVGEKIFYEDGLCICSIKEIDTVRKEYIIVSCDKAYSDSEGKITEGSAVSFDGVDKKYEILRNKDREFIKYLKQNEIIPDFFALSFCKNRVDVENTKNEIEEILQQNIKVLTKIQNKSSVEYANEIIDCSEGVVIERGDLIYALKDYQLPETQNCILKKAKQCGKLSIVSSGFMSEYSKTSIINRAEQSDVYRLKEEKGDFLLLTRETGKAPHALATVDAIQKIWRR